MNRIFLISFLFFSSYSFACDCMQPRIIDQLTYDNFIAKAKILKVTKDGKSSKYHNIEIEIIDLYKGKEVTSLKIASMMNSSCAFLTPQNSIWLIFARYDRKGELSFGACSGTVQIDRKFDLAKYPTAKENYKRSLDLKTQVLRYFKNQKLNFTNQHHLDIGFDTECLKQFRGEENKNDRFAIYELTISKDLSVKRISSIKEFNNTALQKKIIHCLKDSLIIYDPEETNKIPKKAKIILGLFFYPSKGDDLSFISNIDV